MLWTFFWCILNFSQSTSSHRNNNLTTCTIQLSVYLMSCMICLFVKLEGMSCKPIAHHEFLCPLFFIVDSYLKYLWFTCRIHLKKIREVMTTSCHLGKKCYLDILTLEIMYPVNGIPMIVMFLFPFRCRVHRYFLRVLHTTILIQFTSLFICIFNSYNDVTTSKILFIFTCKLASVYGKEIATSSAGFTNFES